MKTVSEIVITPIDFWLFVKRHFSFVIKWSLWGTGAIVLFLLCFPLQYVNKSHIKVLNEGPSSSIKAKSVLMPFTASSGLEEVIAMMRSRLSLQKMIEQLGLQVQCSPSSLIKQGLSHVKEQVLFGLKMQPYFDHENFSFQQVIFSQDREIRLLLKCFADGFYALYDGNEKLLGQAKVGEPLHTSVCDMTLSHIPSFVIMDTFYTLKLMPMFDALNVWEKRLKLYVSKVDRSVIELELRDTDRHLSAKILDALIRIYEVFSSKEQELQYAKQIGHLGKKMQELSDAYTTALQEHTHYLKHNISQHGSMSYLEETERLNTHKNLYSSRLLDIDLELKRLGDADLEPQKLLASASIVANPLTNEFAGLDASLASKLLSEYIQQKQVLQGQLSELLFLKTRVEQPQFDVTSLGSIFEDHVIHDLVSKASVVSLQLQETGNRSVREQERLVEVMDSQKQFILRYLTQMIDLKTMKLDLLNTKIGALQKTLRSLLTFEQRLLKEKLAELVKGMQTLPDKWYQEALLSLQQEQMTTILKGTEQLATSLLINATSGATGIKMLDGAVAINCASSSPFWKKGATVFLLLALGLYAGCFFKECWSGFPVSEPMLRALGFPVVGSLKGELRERQSLLSVLLSSLKPEEQIIVFIEGCDFSHGAEECASLLSKQGYSVLLVQQEQPKASEGYDWHPWDAEELTSLAFKEALSRWKKKYQYIMVSTQFSPSDVRGLLACRVGDVSVIIAGKQRSQDLAPYMCVEGVDMKFLVMEQA